MGTGTEEREWRKPAREGERDRETMERKKHELAVIGGWDILKKQNREEEGTV